MNAYGYSFVHSYCNDEEWNTYSLTHRQIPNNPSRMRSSLKKDGLEIGSDEIDTSKADELKNMQMKVYFSNPWWTAASEYNVRNNMMTKQRQANEEIIQDSTYF